jgi:hypothetical protein
MREQEGGDVAEEFVAEGDEGRKDIPSRIGDWGEYRRGSVCGGLGRDRCQG